METGTREKAVASSDNFSGLKSTIHLAIGARVMLTTNTWVEAGLINGAQGIIRDIYFDETEMEDTLPLYVLVEMDDYKGPKFFIDHDKAKWVPIFPVNRKHQLNNKIERQQLPLRLSFSLTGHKVQGLTLHQGAVIHYPTPQESKMDPMATWGLNYCMLTRVSDLLMIAFINLPDYGRHMKLYQKKKGKDFFQLFLKFDKLCHAQFQQLKKTVSTNVSQQNLPEPNSSTQPSKNQHPKKAQSKNKTTSWQQLPKYSNQKDIPIQELNTVAMLLPGFKNPRTSNNCWFNSVIQLVMHAIRNKSDAPDFPFATLDRNHVHGQAIIQDVCSFLRAPGMYDVSSYCSGIQHPRMTLKQVMLQMMGYVSLNRLHAQYDAAKCLQTLLGNAKQLSFLWHMQEELFQCDDCGDSTSHDIPSSVIPVDISNHMHASNKTFDGQLAIKHFFEGNESGIERFCQNCHGQTCSKSTNLCASPRFLLIQFKRFLVTRIGTDPYVEKITAVSTPFSTVAFNLPGRQLTYKVIASIDHLGHQPVQGHYIAHIFHQNQWFRCDDERVTPLGNSSNDPTINAYIMLLQLTNQQ